jgi:hypothetical protein
MSCHVATCIYLKLIGFIGVILLKRLKAAIFWPVVPILLAVAVVVEQTLSEDSPGSGLFTVKGPPVKFQHFIKDL